MNYIENSFLRPLIDKSTVTDISFNGRSIFYMDNKLGRLKYDKDISIEEAEKRFEGSRYGDFKKAVADAVIEELEPFQNRYKQILESKEYEKVLKDGAARAKEVADVTLRRVQKAVGLLGK